MDENSVASRRLERHDSTVLMCDVGMAHTHSAGVEVDSVLWKVRENENFSMPLNRTK